MGLYLCVFDGDEEIEGVEVGCYSDFNAFRESVIDVVERGNAGSVCPVLVQQPDSDGEWSPDDARKLLDELSIIETAMGQQPATQFNSPWKNDVAKTFGIRPRNLLACFFDVDGEPLVARLRELARSSIETSSPILFQ